MKHEITFDCGMAGRYEKGEDLTHFYRDTKQTPRFGFYWWCWFPEFIISGRGLDINWFCFWVSITFWEKE